MSSIIRSVMAVCAACVALAADPVALFERGELTVSQAAACSVNRIDCIPKPAPAVNFHGTEKKTDLIPVLVCHPWWNELWGDPAKGTRWWGPTNGWPEPQTWQSRSGLRSGCSWCYTWVKRLTENLLPPFTDPKHQVRHVDTGQATVL